MPRPLCERCQRPLDHCLCSLIPALDSRTRVILLQHPSETAHALNTARLAALGLNNAELRVGEVFDDLNELLATPGYRPALLFPGDDAQELVAYGETDDKPLLLIVPDGTWRKARKLLYLNPLLEALPRATLGGCRAFTLPLAQGAGGGGVVDYRGGGGSAERVGAACLFRCAAGTVRGVDRGTDQGHGFGDVPA
ncbi:DTW domain-containing protein [Pseudomonas putida S11]|nr:DTW domain-containing protein [Pseudomonas putida S11]